MRKLTFLFWLVTTMAIFRVHATQVGLSDKEKNAPADSWGPLTYNTQISIATDANPRSITTNQDAQLLVRIKNLSTNQQYGVYIQNAFLSTAGLDFKIISPSGRDLSPIFTKAHKGSGDVLWIHPGQVDGFIVNLRQICKLDELGTYRIILEMHRRSAGGHKQYKIVSNMLVLTLVPGT